MNISIPNSNTMNTDYQSRMLEAQSLFRRVVKAELQILLDQNIPRDIAVKNLLQRIVKCTTEPSESEVRKVMYQFQMNRDDAVRALVVKQELARLKQRGLDSFAAIEELTLKMQLLLPLSPISNRDTDDEVSKGSFSPCQVSKSNECCCGSKSKEIPSPDNKVPEAIKSTPLQAKRKRKTNKRTTKSHLLSTDREVDENRECGQSTSVDADTSVDISKEGLLCQRIGNCSISAASPLDASDAPSILRKPSTRKRRMVSESDIPPDIPKTHRYGAKKKLRLDVDQKIKAQFQDNLVLMKGMPGMSKSSKRTRAKSEGAEAFTSKKHRSE